MFRTSKLSRAFISTCIIYYIYIKFRRITNNFQNSTGLKLCTGHFKCCRDFDVRKSIHHHTKQIFNQQDATVSQDYYLTFMCGSISFGRFLTQHKEITTALGASGFTSGQKRLEHCWSWSGRPRPTTLQPLLSNGKTRGS
jgi:hypothetical protein